MRRQREASRWIFIRARALIKGPLTCLRLYLWCITLGNPNHECKVLSFSSGDEANVMLMRQRRRLGIASVHGLSDKTVTRVISVKDYGNIDLETENTKHQTVKMTDWIYQCEHKRGFSICLYYPNGGDAPKCFLIYGRSNYILPVYRCLMGESVQVIRKNNETGSRGNESLHQKI